MKDLSKLAGASAFSLNSGKDIATKNAVISLDPVREILYLPAYNVRTKESIDASMDALVSLRKALDEHGQSQPIKVYPLPKELLDPTKPKMKYGICIGHRRTLACRLTKDDHADLDIKPRPVQAVVFEKWLEMSPFDRIRYQLSENNDRDPLNFVDEGKAIVQLREAYQAEHGEKLTQEQLAEIYNRPSRTIWALLKASEFHDYARTACFNKYLTDLDTLVTFDAIVKGSEELGSLILEAIKNPEAPVGRSLFNDVKKQMEEGKYDSLDSATFVWPDTVIANKAASAPAVATAPVVQPGNVPGSAAPVNTATPNVSNAAPVETAPVAPSISTEQVAPVTQQDQAPTVVAADTTEPAHKTSAHFAEQSKRVPSGEHGLIMVQFKMGAEATNTFSGELLTDRRAKSPNKGVVAYIGDSGREEEVEVPVGLITIISINHR